MAFVPEQDWVVFEHSFTAIFERVPQGTVTPAIKQELKARGIDLERKLLPAYPYPVWVGVTQVLSNALYAADGEGPANRKLGQLFIEGYARTALGTAVMALLKLIGPSRALARTAKAFRSGNNYFESRLDELAPRTFRLWVNETGTHPQFIAGMMQAALGFCGAVQPQVEPEPSTGPGRTMHITWT